MDEWQHALTSQIAATIEYHRVARGIRRVDLAARCTALGLPTKRPALAALLDGHRQTITLQELLVLAEALDVALAELIVPLHTGEPAISAPNRSEHAFDAATRLFAVHDQELAADRDPYRLYARYRRAATRFERANQRLAELSHDLAVGTATAGLTAGRPHPATEILASEASLSRLVDVSNALIACSQTAPPLDERWSFLRDDEPPVELPILALLPGHGRSLLPLTVYRLHADRLPTGREITSL